MSSGGFDLILGVDPGINGALALLDPFLKIVYEVFDTPTHEVNGKNKVDLYKLSQWMDMHSRRVKRAIIEEVGVMTGKEGRVSMFNFGYSTGTVTGVIAAHYIPLLVVKPQIWKPLMGLSRDKNASRALATKFYPKQQHLWARVKDDGRAEAVLLAHFCADRFK